MIKRFRGTVKVSDVQEAFDNIIARINAAVLSYNKALETYGVDFNIADASIGNKNQTLSVGALKKILDAYNGTVLGCQAFRVNDTKLLISGGIYVKDRTVYRLPTKTVSGTGGIVYYDLDNNNYTFTPQSGHNYVTACRVNTNRVHIMCNTFPALSNNFPQWGLNVSDNSIGAFDNRTFSVSKGQFIGGISGRNGGMSLLGDNHTSYHWWSWRGSSDGYWEPFNFLYVPRNVNNPYTYTGGEEVFKSEHTWNAIQYFNK